MAWWTFGKYISEVRTMHPPDLLTAENGPEKSGTYSGKGAASQRAHLQYNGCREFCAPQRGM